MVEPLLHLTVPFAALKAARLDWRTALFTSIVALIPDLDVLFHVHRSLTHSILILALITLPILALTHRNRTLRNLTLLGIIGVLSHLALDLFSDYTPLLWPLLNESFWVSTNLDVQLKSFPTLITSVKLLIKPTTFPTFQSLQAPLVTSTGVGISLLLLAPTLTEALVRHVHQPKSKSSARTHT